MRLFCSLNQQIKTIDKNHATPRKENTRRGINKIIAKLPTIIEEESFDLPNTVIVSNEENTPLNHPKQVIYASALRPITPLDIYYQTSLIACNYLSQNESESFFSYKQIFNEFFKDKYSFETNLPLIINELADVFNSSPFVCCCSLFFFSKSQKKIAKKKETLTDRFINALISINSFDNYEEANQYKTFIDTLIRSALMINGAN